MKPFEYGCVVKGEVFCPRPKIESILSSAPTAKRALGALVERGILYRHEKEYKIFNPFLREWLARIS